MRFVDQVDTSIRSSSDRNDYVMDGMHRVVRALLEGHRTIRAVQFEIDPEPDHPELSTKRPAVSSQNPPPQGGGQTPGTRRWTQVHPKALLVKPRHNEPPERDRNGGTAPQSARWNPGSDDRCRGFHSTVEWRQSQSTGESHAIGRYSRAAPPRPRQEVSEPRSPSAKWRSGGGRGVPSASGAAAAMEPCCPTSSVRPPPVRVQFLGRNRSRAGRRGHAAGAIT